jgi:hypothetical protein
MQEKTIVNENGEKIHIRIKKKVKFFLAKLMFWRKSKMPINPYNQPFLISVTNDTDEIKYFELFGASRNLTKVVNGVLDIDGVIVKDGITDGNYSDVLFESISNPFVGGITYALINEGGGKNFDNPLLLISRRGNGNYAEKSVNLICDPYQQQKSIIAIKQQYKIDSFTRLCGKIQSKSKLIFYFYPLKNKND